MTGAKNNTAYRFRGADYPLIDIGRGPRVGYLHGILGNPGTPPVVKRLADEYNIVAPTLPGFFGSEACEQLRSIHDWVAALSEIIDACGLDGKPMFASSATAMLALELAAIRPEAFEQLILIAPLGLWDSADPVADLFACLSGQERKLLVKDPASLAAIFEDEGVTNPDALVQRSVDRFVARTTGASLVWPIPEFGLVDRLHRVSCPVTLVWGEDDAYVPRSYCGRFKSHLPQVTSTHVIAGAAHLADLDRPDEVADIVGNALKSRTVKEPRVSI
jgi:pimeloyl-ACP methyl ester carboxylesterase